MSPGKISVDSSEPNQLILDHEHTTVQESRSEDILTNGIENLFLGTDDTTTKQISEMNDRRGLEGEAWMKN